MNNEKAVSIEEKIIYQKLLQYCQKQEDEEDQIYYSWIAEQIDNPHAELQYVCSQLNTLKQTKDNYAYRVLPLNAHGIKKVVLYIKKAMRKCLKWYIEPICFQQTDFNSATVAALGTVTNLIASLEGRIQQLEKQSRGKAVIHFERLSGGMDEKQKLIQALEPSVIFIADQEEQLGAKQSMIGALGYVKAGTIGQNSLWIREADMMEDADEYSI